MEHWVYILQSQSTGRCYCGQTCDLPVRLAQHNDPTNDFSKTASLIRQEKRYHGRKYDYGCIDF
jgi:predicted GIY-YIG superfamily endonuclease